MSAFYGGGLGDETNRKRFTYITGNEEGNTYEGNKLMRDVRQQRGF